MTGPIRAGADLNVARASNDPGTAEEVAGQAAACFAALCVLAIACVGRFLREIKGLPVEGISRPRWAAQERHEAPLCTRLRMPYVARSRRTALRLAPVTFRRGREPASGSGLRDQVTVTACHGAGDPLRSGPAGRSVEVSVAAQQGLYPRYPPDPDAANGAAPAREGIACRQCRLPAGRSRLRDTVITYYVSLARAEVPDPNPYEELSWVDIDGRCCLAPYC